MSLWDNLPTDVIKHIFEYDPTYKEKMNYSLKLFKKASVVCSCNGNNTKGCPYYSSIPPFKHKLWFLPIFKHLV